MPGYDVTDTPAAIPGTSADTIYRLQNTGGHRRIYYDIQPVGSPPSRDSQHRNILKFAESEYVSHGAGDAIFVWGSEIGATFVCTLNELAGS